MSRSRLRIILFVLLFVNPLLLSGQIVSAHGPWPDWLKYLCTNGPGAPTPNRIAKLSGAPSKCVTATTSDTTGLLGITFYNSATGGTSEIQRLGLASCDFDGDTVAGDWVQASTTTGGKCHDAGSSQPSSGDSLGRVLSTNVGVGTYDMLVDVRPSAGSSGGSGTVTNTGGNLTANSLVLGAGTVDTKVLAGFTTNGTSELDLGSVGGGLGILGLNGTTSGTETLTTNATATAVISNGGLVFSGASGAATTISTTTTNANLILAPNGTGQVVVPDGALATAGIKFSSGGGLYRTANNTINYTPTGTERNISFDSGSAVLRLSNNWGLGWSSTTSSLGSTDLCFDRSAAKVVRVDGNTSCNDGLGSIQAQAFLTNTNCASSGGTCSAASSGQVTIAAAATTVTVSTTAVTANSEILVSEDTTLGTRLSVTCNTTTGRIYTITARTAATSFQITSSAAPSTNPACLSYHIIN